MAAPSYRDSFEHTTRFTASARLYRPDTKERNEVHASLRDLKDLMPPDIDPTSDVDIVYIVGDLAVAGVLNLNDDGVTLEDGLEMYKGFERRPCDVEHDRKQMVGYIVKAGLSELGTDRLITEEEARAANKPFNIVTIAAIWRIANKELCAFIEDEAASSRSGAVDTDLSLSFEVGFNQYDVVFMPPGVTDLSQASRVVGPYDDDYAACKKLLRANKGKGKWETGGKVGRILTGKKVPLGQGIVTVPAAAVKGIAPIFVNPHDVDGQDETQADNGYDYSSTQLTLKPEDAAPIQQYVNSIPDEDLYHGEEGSDSYGPDYGRERESHVTALYGIKCENETECTEKVCANHGPITIILGATSAFENADKPYDVLKVGVSSPALHMLNADLKENVKHKETYPTFNPHLTACYMKKGAAAKYVGDTRFVGKTMTFPTLTYSPSEGDRKELPFGSADASYVNRLDQFIATKMPAEVYSKRPLHSSLPPATMASDNKTFRIKIPAGLIVAGADPLKSPVDQSTLNYPKADVTLSDGRVLKGVTVFDGKELELNEDLYKSMEGVVITSMTPQMSPSIEDDPVIHPYIDKVFPTKIPSRVALDEADEVRKNFLQNMPYTDAVLKLFEAAAALFRKITPESGVSSDATLVATASTSSTPVTMSLKLEDFKQIEASLKTADTPVKMQEAMANTALFVKTIMEASEKSVKDAKDADDKKKEAEAAVASMKTELDTIKASLAQIQAAKAASEAQAAFDERMAAVAAAFTLDDEVRAYVVDEVKACVDAAAFDKYMVKAKKLYKGYLKAADQTVNSQDTKVVSENNISMKTDPNKCVESVPGEIDASKKSGGVDNRKAADDDKIDDAVMSAVKTAVASAKDNPTDALDLDVVTAADHNGTQSLIDQMKAAFAGGISIGGEKVNDILARSKKQIKKTA